MKIIETQRLHLRPFHEKDAPDVFSQSREDTLKRFLPDQVYSSIDEAMETISFLLANTQSETQLAYPYVLAIALKESDQYIGHAGLSVIDEGIEIGYAIGEQYQHKGYAREAVGAFIEALLPRFSLNAIYGVVDSDNPPSIRLLESLGFAFLEEHKKGARWRKIYRLETP